ncbi:hypothetical protein NQ314_003018 [Rhamnusium bicolor]|uniref:Cytochrome P450 n=1 Tax=Rhamnusium bicolor TaxID=1586634 RepID=A0AAV8ZPD4_9CUCU|nr:hypothetical protein NQ314_003018 [Rhamnusium bicolor]
MMKREIGFAEQFQEIYRELKARGLKHGGYYSLFTPGYMPIDPELIKCILQKDFSHFMNHGMYVNEEVDPLTGHLFNLEGKMKMMFETLVKCSEGLEYLLNDHAIIQDAVDIKDVLARFTTDVIGSCAFGLECNSLKNPNAEFRVFGRRIFDSSLSSRIKRIAVMLIPRYILIKTGFKLTRKEIESFFMNAVKDTVEYREKNKIFRKDFMHLLLQLKNRGKVTEDAAITEVEGNEKVHSFLTLNELAAQCFVFFLAGFETSATTMTFALYELAVNQEIQDNLREEIQTTLKKYDNKITYESVMEMTYLEKVIYGTDVELQPGTRVHIPIYAIHNDPEYYPNPEVFDPERFSEENNAKRTAFTFLPFGLRFGLLQSRVGLATILMNFRVTLNENTKTPIKLDKQLFILGIEDGLWLNVSRNE